MAKIGIFDSGSGGLSVYREIVKLLPSEQYVYVSDSAYCPYGEKSREQVTERARIITEFLLSLGCEVIVVACNTATAAAIATLRAEYDVPFIGMEPAVKLAAMSTRTGVIGVLATAGTLKASKYIDTRDRYSRGKKVIESVGQGFVELVENGDLDSENARTTVRKSVLPLIQAGADVLVLGCTHYPFLIDTIRSVAEEALEESGEGLAGDCGDGLADGRTDGRGDDCGDGLADGRGDGGKRTIDIIDPAPAVARHLVDVMKEHGIAFTEAGGAADGDAADGDPTTDGTPADDSCATAGASSEQKPKIELYSSGDLESLRRIYALL